MSRTFRAGKTYFGHLKILLSCPTMVWCSSGFTFEAPAVFIVFATLGLQGDEVQLILWAGMAPFLPAHGDALGPPRF